MSTPGSVANHPIHPMLVVFPIGLWVFSLIADIVYLAGGPPAWATAAFYTMGGGIIGAAVAAIPGFVDLLSLPVSRARKVAVIHMTLNVVILALFAINFGIRWPGEAPGTTLLGLSLVSIVALVVSGWLGGELVYVHGVAVTQGADVFTKPAESRHRDTHGPASGKQAA